MPTNAGDIYATQAFCYNWITNAWTRWPIDIACGGVNPADNLLYLSRWSTNPTHLYQERKNYLYTDYMDDQTPVIITGTDATGLIVSLNAVSSSWVGYGLDQTDSGIAIITAVDTGANTVTLSLTNSTLPGTPIVWVNGAANIDVPIPGLLTYCPMTAGFVHYVKDVTRINFWINNGNFQVMTVGFISDITGPGLTQPLQANNIGLYGFGPYGLTPYGGAVNFPQCIQTLVPTDQSKAHWIEPSIALSFPTARLSCCGVTSSYDVISDVQG
jgi:hypothetical protein